MSGFGKGDQGVIEENGQVVAAKLDAHITDPNSDLAVQVPDSDYVKGPGSALAALREPTPEEVFAGTDEEPAYDESDKSGVSSSEIN